MKLLFQGNANENGEITAEEIHTMTSSIFSGCREARDMARTSQHFEQGERVCSESRFVAFLEHIHNVLQSKRIRLRYSITIAIYCLLEQIRSKHEVDGNYMEAGDVHENMKELLEKEISERTSSLHSKQLRDIEHLKMAHKKQEEDFFTSKFTVIDQTYLSSRLSHL